MRGHECEETHLHVSVATDRLREISNVRHSRVKHR